jgi:hypothetical protein
MKGQDMAIIPKATDSIAARIDRYSVECQTDQPREYMGVSGIGHLCERWVWLNFRWAVREKFEGRMLRLFDRGHREEVAVIANLRGIGVDVQSTGANQSRVNLGKHLRGHMDGLIEKGIPGISKKPHILEIKTHNKKSFDQLVKDGVQKSKPQHYAQMQLYMVGAKVDRALYYAVCKDDDRIHTERIKLDQAYADKMIAKAHRLALSDEMPPPISRDPSWYQCQWCAARPICHEKQPSTQVNCRTCANATVRENDWRCERHDADGIPVEFQREGCEAHVLHPHLVPWPRKASPDKWEAVYVIDGKDVRNGEPDAFTFGSKEILANPSECANPQPLTVELRQEMGGRITT